jgi:ribosome biogenesis GTPase
MYLERYGFPKAILEAVRAQGGDELPARITAVHKERYALVCEAGETHAHLKSSTYFNDQTEAFPTAGDYVLLQHNPAGDGVIVRTLPRRSYFARRSPERGRGEQAVAANFDAVLVMQSLNSDFNPRRLERYLALAWQSGAEPVVVLNKSDLAEYPENQLAAARRVAGGADVFAVSAKTGDGLDALSGWLCPGKTVVLLGSSGVGKSSFVNALAGRELMAVGGVREDDGKGRHTTTHRQLILLKSGVLVIDTPGMRELGMWDADEGLAEAFSDVEAYLGQCRFSDCRHENEPGCAVRAAIARGELPQERWDSYQKLQRESGYAADQAKYLTDKRKRFKEIAKINKRTGGKKASARFDAD